MSSDGGDGDDTVHGYIPGSIEPYVSSRYVHPTSIYRREKNPSRSERVSASHFNYYYRMLLIVSNMRDSIRSCVTFTNIKLFTHRQNIRRINQ